MTGTPKRDELRRLDDKSLDGQMLWELQNGFELSPRESQGVLETVKLLYTQRPEAQTGRVSLWVVKRDASVGKPLNELEKIQVWITLHGGQEDLEAYEAYGHGGLRRQKILRITEEILDQNGVATQEDLACLLGTSIRTVRRDIAYLLKQGQRVVTRGGMPALETGADDQQRDEHLRRHLQFRCGLRRSTSYRGIIIK